MKTANDYLSEMEQNHALTERKLTFPQYAEQLEMFSETVCQIVSGLAYHENMKFSEAGRIMEATAIEKGLQNQPAVIRGIATMKKLNKEMTVVISGIQSERLVSKTLEYVDRPNTKVFHNVYLSDGQEETEIDEIVLTDSGILLLETKSIKTDRVITKNGYLKSNRDLVPIGEKMSTKRKLLKSCLQQEINKRGLKIPVFVDSFIVFCPPKNVRVQVEDQYHLEKYCFRTDLNKVIKNYIGSVYYKGEINTQLAEILTEMESKTQDFELPMDFDEVRKNLAEAFAILQDTPKSVIKKASAIQNCMSSVQDLQKSFESLSQNVFCQANKGPRYIAISFAGFMLQSASKILNCSSQ